MDWIFQDAPRIVLQLVTLVMFGLLGWQMIRYEFLQNNPTDTAAIKLTSEEVNALRKILKPAPAPSTGGTKVAISQIRGLDERLAEIEKVTAPGALSLTASSDPRVIQHDFENLKDREVSTFRLSGTKWANWGVRRDGCWAQW